MWLQKNMFSSCRHIIFKNIFPMSFFSIWKMILPVYISLTCMNWHNCPGSSRKYLFLSVFLKYVSINFTCQQLRNFSSFLNIWSFANFLLFVSLLLKDVIAFVCKRKKVCNYLFSVFFFSFSSVRQKRTGECFFTNVSSFVTQEKCDKDRFCFIEQTSKSFSQCSLYCQALCMRAWHVIGFRDKQ